MVSMMLFLAVGVAIPTEGEFRPYYQAPEVVVEMAKTKESEHPWVRGRTTLHVSVEKVVGVLKNFAEYPKLLSEIVKKLTVLETGENSARFHFVWHFPFPLRNRDGVSSYRYEKLPQNAHRVFWATEKKEGDPSEGVRIERVEGETRVTPLKESAQLVYTYYADLGGDFGESANTKAYQREASHYFNAIRRQVGLAELPDK